MIREEKELIIGIILGVLFIISVSGILYKMMEWLL